MDGWSYEWTEDRWVVRQMDGWMMNGLMLQAKLLKYQSKVDLEWDPPHTHTQTNK